MPKRLRVELEDIANDPNMYHAAYLAARGRRNRPQILEFQNKFQENIHRIGREILDESYRPKPMRQFVIHDPKRRIIDAPVFEDRVVHHALILQIGGFLDQALIDNTFACRRGLGPLRAVWKVQTYCRKYPWYVKLDIRSYFHSIDHDVLRAQLQRRFKGDGLHRLIGVVIAGFQGQKRVGLPIGALTSQHFANYYLNDLDRMVIALDETFGYVRYMDDFLCWADSSQACKRIHQRIRDFLGDHLKLEVHPRRQIQRSCRGVTFGGYRVLPYQVLLSHRRKMRYLAHCRKYESAYVSGGIGVGRLQQLYQSAYALTVHADSLSWRKRVHRGGSEFLQ
ncbi:MAG: reverse transcriptase domain-containing protein [Planctomycetota bacterium]|jgi:RNA-directed DNA polymerase